MLTVQTLRAHTNAVARPGSREMASTVLVSEYKQKRKSFLYVIHRKLAGSLLILIRSSVVER